MRRWLPVLLLLLSVPRAVATFEPPSENDRLTAIGSRVLEPEPFARLLQPDADFQPIGRPNPGDWLAEHEEAGQTFGDFLDSRPNRPGPSRHIIYLQPIGEFPAEASPSLPLLRDYAAAYFQLEVRILPAAHPRRDDFSPRENRHTHRRQLLTASIRTYLAARLPADAFCLLGVTMEDLYPAPSWNYVFGEASLSERVGVYSFARYDPAFFGEQRSSGWRRLMLERACKVLVHETGHMFGLAHCIYFQCVMNGSNSLEETDRQVHQLCPVCLRKLHWDAPFDPTKRYRDLGAFYRQQEWTGEILWTNRQLAKVAPADAAPAGR